MIPILYDYNEKSFSTNGIGVLADAISCTATEELNGIYELELKYPTNTNRYFDLAVDRIIYAKPNEIAEPQAFRIYNISKPINGIATVNAEHISYQMNSIITRPINITRVDNLVGQLNSGEAIAFGSKEDFRFNLALGDPTEIVINWAVPMTLRSLLLEGENSVANLGKYEIEFDNYITYLRKRRGQDTTIKIAYGKNMKGLSLSQSIEGVVTHILPYWYDGANGTLITSVEPVLIFDGNEPDTKSYSRIVVLDCSGDFQEPPTPENLQARAIEHGRNFNKSAYYSLTVDFVNLGDTEEYKQFKYMERIGMGDGVTVSHPAIGLNAKLRAVKLKFDVLKERYLSVDFGNPQISVSKNIATQNYDIANLKSRITQLSKNLIDL